MVIRGDALHLPLADESVDLVVTSPPRRTSHCATTAPAMRKNSAASQPPPPFCMPCGRPPRK